MTFNVSFGDHVEPATTTASADWIGRACHGAPGTVGSLVPNHYEAALRIYAPAPCPGDWWALYRDLFGIVASIGEQYTSNPSCAWFAIWEGHGFDQSTTHVAAHGHLDVAAEQALDQQRRALREEDSLRNAAIRNSLAELQQFDRPDRSYYLLEGPVSAVVQLRAPGFDEWRNPDLFWPDDRRWFVATDVDFWSLYIAGERAFVDDLARNAPTPSELVALDDPLVTEV